MQASPCVRNFLESPRCCSLRSLPFKERSMIIKNASRLGARNVLSTESLIRTSLITLAICSSVRVASAQQAQGGGMHGMDGGGMAGWGGEGAWLWLVIGILVVVLLVVLIAKVAKK
jgi:hypothetical protein